MIHANTARCLKYDGYNQNTLKWILDDLDKKVKEASYHGNSKTIGVYVSYGDSEKNKALVDELTKFLGYLEYNVDINVSATDCGSDTNISICISW